MTVDHEEAHMDESLYTTATLRDGVLCSSGPMPTDGLPERTRCTDCGLRQFIPPGSCPSCDNFRGVLVLDGPFPVTVGVVEETWQCSWCGVVAVPDGGGRLHVCRESPTQSVEPVRIDAVTVLVEVTGPSHRPDAYWNGDHKECSRCAWTSKRRDSVNGWHTAVRLVERLDTPVPIDVPTEMDWHDDRSYSVVPAVWWVPA